MGFRFISTFKKELFSHPRRAKCLAERPRWLGLRLLFALISAAALCARLPPTSFARNRVALMILAIESVNSRAVSARAEFQKKKERRSAGESAVVPVLFARAWPRVSLTLGDGRLSRLVAGCLRVLSSPPLLAYSGPSRSHQCPLAPISPRGGDEGG